MRFNFLLFCFFLTVPSLAIAQHFAGSSWSDELALKAWIGGNFYLTAHPSESLGTEVGVVQQIDTCVSHAYKGRFAFNGSRVFTAILGKKELETADKHRFKWLIVGTTDGYDCIDCKTVLSGSLWELGDKKWSILLEERDFAQTGSNGIAPLIDFAFIGADNQLGVFVWERSVLDSLYHFYKGDIYTPINRQFVRLTNSNYNLDNRLPNICSAVSSSSEIPYNYESNYEFIPNPKTDIYDLKIRQQGTEWQETGLIVPFAIDYSYVWGGTSYMLHDSVLNKDFLPYKVVGEAETFFTVARKFNIESDDLKEDNPLVAMRSSSLLHPGETLFIRKNMAETTSNTEPSLASIEAAVGVPADEDTTRLADTPDLQTTKEGLLSHRVQVGETLFGLCKKYGVQMTDIKQYNNLPEDYAIQIGQVLMLEKTPNSAVSTHIAQKNTEKKEKKEPVDRATEIAQEFHIVKAGETLFSIARKYNAQLHILQELNKMKNYTLFKGQKLRVR